MSFLGRLVTSGFLLTCACSSAWAQTSPVQLTTGNYINAWGLTATIGTVTCPNNSTCPGTDELEVVSTGRDTITFEVVNSTGSAIFSTSSSSSKTMTIQLVITPNAAYQPAGGTVSGAVLTTVGVDSASRGSPTVSGSAVFALGKGETASTLTDSLRIGTGSQTIVSGTPAGTPNKFSTDSNSFTVTESLNIDKNSASGTSLSLTSIALRLDTVPEPATVSLILVGFAGLAMARRRRISR
jgi:hypothetical protein